MDRYLFHQRNANTHECNCKCDPVGANISTMKVKLHVTKSTKTKYTNIWFWGDEMPTSTHLDTEKAHKEYYLWYTPYHAHRGSCLPFFWKKDEQASGAFRLERGVPPDTGELMGSLLFYVLFGTAWIPSLPEASPPSLSFNFPPPSCRILRQDRHSIPPIYGGRQYCPKK